MGNAAVVLKTGVQGSGKTLSAVQELAAMQRAWDKDPASWRPVYVHGIRDLKLPHNPLPIYPRGGKPGDTVEVDKLGQPVHQCDVDWSSVPEGAIIFIDEAHKLFPVRPAGAAVPASVGWFALGRQNDNVVYLMTQTPKSLDVEVRRRVGLHQHYQSLFAKRSIVFEWPEVSENLAKAGALNKRVWAWPREAFDYYVSASGHSGGAGIGFPLWAYVPILLVVAGSGAAWYGWDRWAHRGGGHPAAVASPGASGSAAPGAPGGASSAPVVAPAVAPAASRPALAGCMVMRQRCLCIDPEGYRVELPFARCLVAARDYGGDMPYPSSPPPLVAASWSASASPPAVDPGSAHAQPAGYAVPPQLRPANQVLPGVVGAPGAPGLPAGR